MKYDNDFRRIQEKSRRKSFESVRKQETYITGNEGLRRRLPTIFKGWLDCRGINSSNNMEFHLKLSKNTYFNIYENVNETLFYNGLH